MPIDMTHIQPPFALRFLAMPMRFLDVPIGMTQIQQSPFVLRFLAMPVRFLAVPIDMTHILPPFVLRV